MWTLDMSLYLSKVSSTFWFTADWLVGHVLKISQAQLVRDVSCFNSLYRQTFSSFLPQPAHSLKINMAANLLNHALLVNTWKTPALQTTVCKNFTDGLL